MIIRNINSDVVQAAVKKITDGTKEVKGSKEGAVKSAVCDALVSFCDQSEDFARAVVDTGKCMAECLTEIMKDVGSSISDVEVYRRAVAFWMEGAEVRAEIRIVLPDAKSPDVREDAPTAPKKVKILSLEDLM